MKAKYVPFTTVSGDPEIQKMREILTSGKPINMDPEGTIFERMENGKTEPLTRRPVVPWAPLAVPRKCAGGKEFWFQPDS